MLAINVALEIQQEGLHRGALPVDRGPDPHVAHGPIDLLAHPGQGAVDAVTGQLLVRRDAQVDGGEAEAVPQALAMDDGSL